MSTQFAFDLRLARKKAGFIQADVAHLLGSRQSNISQLENARRLPTISEYIALSLVYGRTFDDLYLEVLSDRKALLARQLTSLPPLGRTSAGTFNRSSSLARLTQRLAEQSGHGRS